jgi:hypothetical protein
MHGSSFNGDADRAHRRIELGSEADLIPGAERRQEIALRVSSENDLRTGRGPKKGPTVASWERARLARKSVQLVRGIEAAIA